MNFPCPLEAALPDTQQNIDATVERLRALVGAAAPAPEMEQSND